MTDLEKELVALTKRYKREDIRDAVRKLIVSCPIDVPDSMYESGTYSALNGAVLTAVSSSRPLPGTWSNMTVWCDPAITFAGRSVPVPEHLRGELVQGRMAILVEFVEDLHLPKASA